MGRGPPCRSATGKTAIWAMATLNPDMTWTMKGCLVQVTESWSRGLWKQSNNWVVFHPPKKLPITKINCSRLICSISGSSQVPQLESMYHMFHASFVETPTRWFKPWTFVSPYLEVNRWKAHVERSSHKGRKELPEPRKKTLITFHYTGWLDPYNGFL